MAVRFLSTRQTILGGAGVVRSGLLRAYRPDHLLRIGLALRRLGMGPGMGPTVGGVVYPGAVGMVDDTGSITMRQLDARCTAMARDLARTGLAAGDTLGVLARNSAAFYEVAVGASRLGLDVVYLNTGFTADQVADVVRRHSIRAVACDAEYTGRLPSHVPGIPTTGGATASQRRREAEPEPPIATAARASHHVILTSGTTGTPKGVARTGGSIDAVIALLSGLPLRVRETHLIAAPLFHAWGWLNMMLTMLLSSTVVLSRRFHPEQALATIEREKCQVLVAVPTMLQKIMDLPVRTRRRYDPTSLRIVAVSGSALSERLSDEFMDEFGDVLYSLYGSTEVGYATVATPADLRAAPGTAGRPLPAVDVRVVDADGRPCPPGRPGSIRVSGRETVRLDQMRAGPVATGDLGWTDEAGRLFVGARQDDMIIVGGENVYPIVVERALERHPEVVEAAVVDAPDRVLGQVVVAHVALRDTGGVTADALRAWCRAHLAPFQVPRRVVIHDRLPRNETGKVEKLFLRESAGGRRRGRSGP